MNCQKSERQSSLRFIYIIAHQVLSLRFDLYQKGKEEKEELRTHQHEMKLSPCCSED